MLEPQQQSLPAGWRIGCFRSSTAIALWAPCPTPASMWPLCKQADDADPQETACRHVLLVFKPLPRGMLTWALWRWSCKTGGSCSFLIHRNPECCGKELRHIFSSFTYPCWVSWLDGRGENKELKENVTYLHSNELWKIKALYSEHTTLLGLNSKATKHKERLLFCSVCLGEGFWYLHGCCRLALTAGEEE